MDALPQVGHRYQHKKWGSVVVEEIVKRGRGYSIWFNYTDEDGDTDMDAERLKDFQKATA